MRWWCLGGHELGMDAGYIVKGTLTGLADG